MHLPARALTQQGIPSVFIFLKGPHGHSAIFPPSRWTIDVFHHLTILGDEESDRSFAVRGTEEHIHSYYATEFAFEVCTPYVPRRPPTGFYLNLAQRHLLRAAHEQVVSF